MKNKIKYSILLLLFCVSCKRCKENPPEKLCNGPVPYTENGLRLDGYYFGNDGDILIFYRNGVMLYGGVSSEANLDSKESAFADGSFHANAVNDEYKWGVFKVSSNSFNYERHYPSTNAWLVYVMEGNIENDTTIHITKSYRCDGSEFRGENNFFRFKPFSPKPDSTNSFVN